MLRFFSYSFTASDGYEESNAGRVESPSSIIMHHGFKSKEACVHESKNIDCAKQHHTPHCWLSAKVMYLGKLIQAFLLVDSFSFNIVVEERSYIYIYMEDCHILIVALDFIVQH